MLFTILNKDLTEDNPSSLLKFKTAIQLDKGHAYTIVIVNTSPEQSEDEAKNKLFFCYGGIPELENAEDDGAEGQTAEGPQTLVESGKLNQGQDKPLHSNNKRNPQNNIAKKQALVIEYLPTDFTQVCDFMRVDDVQAELLLNDRREDQ